ncbi:hypothetical protein ONA02_06905 [Mycoplasmopsis felis]|uniref:hypothetical protein n=1 Tax=Mycoplasmopsis felis TaxID=33923 RepID=UPI002286CDFE|nr:hypothetical protein [Mycoplasmopsis felis]WAM02272.1 hypothetical protein ONA02_06905 [Mycoplasmopsis felis]
MKKFVKAFLMLSSFSSLVSAVSCFEIKLGDPFGNGIGSGEGDSKLDPNDKYWRSIRENISLKKRKFIIVLLMKITI